MLLFCLASHSVYKPFFMFVGAVLRVFLFKVIFGKFYLTLF